MGIDKTREYTKKVDVNYLYACVNDGLRYLFTETC